MNLFDLTNRTALVTGARRGIGLAMATALAEAGADIIGVSASLEAGRSEVRDRVEVTGRSFRGYAIDLGDRQAVDELVATVDRDKLDIDILVNNAGTIRRAPAVEHGDELWDEVLEVNLTSAFRLTRALGAGMLKRGRGKIVFTASILSFQGGINVASYAASKSGLAGATKAFSNEWASSGVNVNAIAPGYITTDNTQALYEDPARHQAILDRIPAGRWGVSDDLGGAVVFLASPASDYVHGIVLPVDGGWLGR